MVLQYDSHNLTPVICFHTYFVLFEPYIGPIHALPRWIRVDWEAMEMEVTPHYPNLQDWNLAIGWFDFMYRTFVKVGVLLFCRDAVGVSLQFQMSGLRRTFASNDKSAYYITCWSECVTIFGTFSVDYFFDLLLTIRKAERRQLIDRKIEKWNDSEIICKPRGIVWH